MLQSRLGQQISLTKVLRPHLMPIIRSLYLESMAPTPLKQ